MLIYIGKLTKSKLGKYNNKILTDEVVLTNERIMEHILKKHLVDYNELRDYIKEIIENPDYIIEDNKHFDTIILLKYINCVDKFGRVVVKLVLETDEKHPKNSIITLMKLNKRTWNQTIKNRGKIIFDKTK